MLDLAFGLTEWSRLGCQVCVRLCRTAQCLNLRSYSSAPRHAMDCIYTASSPQPRSHADNLDGGDGGSDLHHPVRHSQHVQP